MNEKLREVLQIRYVKLHFSLQVLEDCLMPASKTSALRGGMGEMLLRANCISDRKCENCAFESECIVQRTMYSKLVKKPPFLQVGDSFGYVIECEDYREELEAGDVIPMNLILFGKTIVYFSQYLQALAALGQQGIGRYQARFQIAEITNTKGEAILDGNNIYMNRYQVSTLAEYVAYRMVKFQEHPERIRLNFKTPVTIKFRGEFLREFDSQALMESVVRRIFILDYFEQIESDAFYQKERQAPILTDQEVKGISVRRFSGRQESAMWLKGIKGMAELENVDEELLMILLAGELTHIGKNTSFGFGRYRVV